jgi:hypothetical protein
MELNNENIMNSIETLTYFKNRFDNKERIVTSRYNDGEYLLMNNMKGHVAQKDTSLISTLLNNAIKNKNQLVCINYLKPHNVEKRDIWFKTQKFLMDISQHDLYGSGNWWVHDLCNDNILLPLLFSNNVLLVTNFANECTKIISPYQSKLTYLESPSKNAVDNYMLIKSDILKIHTQFKTILFACGPIGKVIISDIVNDCNCNLVDIGSLVNALINETDKWPMSWSKNLNPIQVQNFFNKLK